MRVCSIPAGLPFLNKVYGSPGGRCAAPVLWKSGNSAEIPETCLIPQFRQICHFCGYWSDGVFAQVRGGGFQIFWQVCRKICLKIGQVRGGGFSHFGKVADLAKTRQAMARRGSQAHPLALFRAGVGAISYRT